MTDFLGRTAKQIKIDALAERCKLTVAEAVEMPPFEFVHNHLFPFMRREAGHGFGMEYWKFPLRHGGNIDSVHHRAPACGTVACIGGTMHFLVGNGDERVLAAILGLTASDARILFYGWKPNMYPKGSWPADLMTEFAEANTATKKERVAEKMVLRAIKTEGRCFHEQL